MTGPLRIFRPGLSVSGAELAPRSITSAVLGLLGRLAGESGVGQVAG